MSSPTPRVITQAEYEKMEALQQAIRHAVAGQPAHIAVGALIAVLCEELLDEFGTDAASIFEIASLPVLRAGLRDAPVSVQ